MQRLRSIRRLMELPISLSKSENERLAGFSAGLLFSRSLRRIIHAAGYSISNGWLGPKGRRLGVWGRILTSRRVLARLPKANVVTFEDAFLRSVLPGLGSPPVGINIDDTGVHFDAHAPSKLEKILQTADFDDELLARAMRGRSFLRHYGISKYNVVPRGYRVIPESGYILVIDQVAGDASISGGQASADSFAKMLTAARVENPGKRIVIRTHPAVADGLKIGHFSHADVDENTELLSIPINPWDLLEGAAKVYCVTTQMGFEAILAGHRPIVFGAPFYVGWGLSDDRQSTPRRSNLLTVDELFAGAMLVYPFWYNHARRCACSFEEAAQQLLAQARHHWDGLSPVTALGMRLWKRKNVARFLSGLHRVKFVKSDHLAVDIATKSSGKVVVWASRESDALSEICKASGVPLLRMEDGFLRSKGLGAELTPAASLMLDDRGIYYDPSKESQLEFLISQSLQLPEFAIERAAMLHAKIIGSGVSKYNLNGETKLDFPKGRKVILVPGQVEDDVSILLGSAEVKTNIGLLKEARAAHPDGYIVYKPHPDVLAGLREGSVSESSALNYCDQIVENADVAKLIEVSDEIWTITSLLGFEALLRGKPVVCLGMPFYAGWGLTRDLGPECGRRDVKVSLDQLVHATLIDYPRYMDPVSYIACTAELIVDRLAAGDGRKPAKLRILAKLQGVFANYLPIWR